MDTPELLFIIFKGNFFFSSLSQSLVSKTIDAASAQFAASALVTSDQLMALKSKEEGVGVNGVVSASGWSFKLYTFTLYII